MLNLLKALMLPLLGVGIVNEVGQAGPNHDGQVLHRSAEVAGGIYGVPAQGPVTQPTNPAQAAASYDLGVSAVVIYGSAQTFAAVNANTTVEQAATVTGVRAGSLVHVLQPTAQAGIGIVGARVSAANTLGVTFANPTAGNVTPTGALVFRVIEIRGPLIQSVALTPAGIPTLTTAEQVFTITEAAGQSGLSSSQVGLTSGVTALNQDPPASTDLAAGSLPGSLNRTPVILGIPQTVLVNKPTAQAGLGIVNARVTGNNGLGLTFSNTSGAPITPTAAQTYTYFACRGISMRGPVHYAIQVTPAATATITVAEQAFACDGVSATDRVVGWEKITAQAGLGIAGVRVAGADSIGVSYVNPTAGGLTATTELFHVWIDKSDNSDAPGGLGILRQFTAVITPAAVAAITTAEQAFAITPPDLAGAAGTDSPCIVNAAVGDAFASDLGAQLPAGLGIAGARISGANTLAINFINVTAAAITPGTLLVTVLVAQPGIAGETDGLNGSSVGYRMDIQAHQQQEEIASLRNALVAMNAVAGS